MIRSICQYNESGTRCMKVTRAHRVHKFCRVHTKEITGSSRPILHQITKVKVTRIKPMKIVEVSKKGKKKS